VGYVVRLLCEKVLEEEEDRSVVRRGSVEDKRNWSVGCGDVVEGGGAVRQGLAKWLA